ncbi:MAG: polysaccharide biosynthesis C-terminal domain-containing protein [Bacteroidetes bacterium]|nr:polysaccharide biosynthesis C-terminal domain-containing protein [Bacteroidota bacterium]
MLPRILNFFLVPLHTYNMFSREEYGQITKVLSIVAFVNVVYMFGMETSFFRFATRENADPGKIFRLAQTVVLLVSSALTLPILVWSDSIAYLLGLGHRSDIINWVATIMFIDALVAIPFARLRLEHKAMLFASAKILNVLVLVGLNIYFLKFSYHHEIGIGYVFLANLVANALFVLFFFNMLIGWRPEWDKTISPQMIQYAYPVMLTGLAGMTNEMFSRLTLDWWLPENFYGQVSNQDALGIFGACYKFAVFMNLGIQSFRYAAEPFFFSNAKEKNSPALFARVNHFFIITACVVLLAVSLNLDILQYLIGEEFREGLSIVPVLLLAYLCLGVYYNISIWFKLTDRTYFGTILTVGGALVTIGANYLLIPIWGYTGSSFAALACYAGMMIFCYIIGRYYYPVPYKVTNGLFYIGLSVLMVWAAQQVVIDNLFASILIHFLIIILFVGFAFWKERPYWSENS